MIHCVNGEGWSLPPYILLKGVHHLANWYTETNLPGDWALKTTESGWIDNATGVDWLKHFDKHTASRAESVYRILIIGGHDKPCLSRIRQILWGQKDYAGMFTSSFVSSHSSFLTQPLDFGCISPLKRAHSDEINKFPMVARNYCKGRLSYCV